MHNERTHLHFYISNLLFLKNINICIILLAHDQSMRLCYTSKMFFTLSNIDKKAQDVVSAEVYYFVSNFHLFLHDTFFLFFIFFRQDRIKIAYFSQWRHR